MSPPTPAERAGTAFDAVELGGQRLRRRPRALFLQLYDELANNRSGHFFPPFKISEPAAAGSQLHDLHRVRIPLGEFVPWQGHDF
ncbi:hypothetical protein [Paradevosia shaoguanensis]|uniref:hypothetical protein n=1 Tax=Paradevosia shaoguanensis TaxID=1335043 RepID=UPI003C771A96